MRKFLHTALILIGLLFTLAGGVLAQGAPEPINDALADLNARLGRSLTLNDFNWTWEQQTFSDTSLGCPQEGQTYAQQQIVGYRFLFYVDDNVYDYRVSADRTILILCSVTPVEEDTQTDTPTDSAAPSNALCPPPPQGLTYMQTRLTAGIQARVTPGLPNNVRAEPATTGTITGQIPGGGIFTVLAGPQCDEQGYLWWQVDFDGLVGWTAEGRNNEYLLEPLPSAPLPTDLQVISAENFAQITEVARLQGNFASRMAWAYSTETDAPPVLVVLGAAGSEGAWLYTLTTLNTTPRILTGSDPLTAVAFGPNANLGLFGSANGGVRFWDTAPGAGLVERTFLQGHDSPVSAVAFSSNGATIVSSGGRAYLREDQPDNLYAITLWDVATVAQQGALRGHTGEVTGLFFIQNNAGLVSAGMDGTIRIWDVNTRQALTVVETGVPILSLALSMDGTALAAGHEDGSITLWLLGDMSASLAGLQGHIDAVNGLAFSPDGTALVSGGEDGTVVLWDLENLAEEPRILTGHQSEVESVLVSPDGLLVVSLGADNTVRFWGTSPGSVG